MKEVQSDIQNHGTDESSGPKVADPKKLPESELNKRPEDFVGEDFNPSPLSVWTPDGKQKKEQV
jgi:hypothetical protein